MSKRVAFVINQLGGVGAGGSDRVVSVIANEFAAREWAVDILALTGDNTIDRELAPSINVRFETPIKSSVRAMQVGLRMLRGAGLVRSYVNQHPDAVIISFIAWVNMCTVAGVIGTKHGPLVLSERTDPASDPNSPVARKLRDAAYRRADALVFQTPDAQAYFSDIVQAPSEVIPNPVTAGLPEWSPPASGIEVVSAARLEAQKNIPLLIDAFAPVAQAHSEARLRIFGEGKLRAELQSHIDELGLSDAVTLEGFVSDIHERVAKGSMFVMSSDFEGMPNALLEAMAIGMPVISVDCPIGGPRMMIEHDVSGVLVPRGDVEAMSAQIQRLIDFPAVARALAANAAQARDRYSIEHVVDSWERLIGAVTTAPERLSNG